MNEKKCGKMSLTTAILFFVLIIIIIGVALVYIGLTEKNNAEKLALQEQNNKLQSEIEDLKEKTIDEQNDNNNKEEVFSELKKVLLDNKWVVNNLYASKNCFDERLNSANQKLTFEVLSDNLGDPIVIVENHTAEDFISTCYKVYLENGEVKAKNITGGIGHPTHESFQVDKAQGLAISIYGHMGDYKFTAYDVKENEIKIYDQYENEDNDGDYEYRGDKEYNLIYIEKELNEENINKYLK